MRDKARNLRYKRPALASMGYWQMVNELDEICAACGDIRYFIDSEDGGNILEEMIGDEDESWEFRMAFSELEAQSEQLSDVIRDNIYDEDEFNDCTVALIGNRYEQVGYDDFEEDYYSLTSYEAGLAETEAGKRLMRLTKAQMISTIGQCVGVLMAFIDLRQRYDYLKSTMDIIRGDNVSVLQNIRAIDDAYEKAIEEGRFSKAWNQFDRLTAALPQRVWLE